MKKAYLHVTVSPEAHQALMAAVERINSTTGKFDASAHWLLNRMISSHLEADVAAILEARASEFQSAADRIRQAVR